MIFPSSSGHMDATTTHTAKCGELVVRVMIPYCLPATREQLWSALVRCVGAISTLRVQLPPALVKASRCLPWASHELPRGATRRPVASVLAARPPQALADAILTHHRASEPCVLRKTVFASASSRSAVSRLQTAPSPVWTVDASAA